MLEELIKRCHPIIDVSNSVGTIGLTIEEIREVLDPVKTVNWISTKDKLPPKDTLVIAAVFGSDMVYLEDGETLDQAMERLRKTCRRITLAYIGEDGWTDWDGYPCIIHPSYWMPLPELPEEPS